jgi:superfamily II DNA or RNA helicase
MARYGRDPRRRLTTAERRWLYERAGGQCQKCSTDLGPDYHSAHLGAWANGGATSLEQMEAWCPSCNLKLGARDAKAPGGVTLRDWQARALPVILNRLWASGVATLHAAPGAGKTLFAGAVFRQLYDAGLVTRMIIVVPNLALVGQWARSLGRMAIHVDTEPRDGHIEHPETVGAVITYQSLANTAGAHAAHPDRDGTLVILDEVHHVGESRMWGNAVRLMIGEASNGPPDVAAVLNMTGTLFRSSKSQRISTVRYDRIDTRDGEKLQAVADWSEPTANLIGVELRAPDLYAYGAQVQMVDVQSEQVLSADIADLDQSQRSAAIKGMFNSKQWLNGFAAEAVRMLRNQWLAMGEKEHLKLLFVADSIRSARLAADALNTATRQDFARLVTSAEPGALRTLKSAAEEPRSCAIVAVRMVTEGFDCPQISTIAYATNIIADLFIAQMMARAMRITKAERADGRMLPAQILIPDHEQLRKAFAAALKSAMHMVDIPDDPSGDPAGGGTGGARLPRYELLHMSDPRLRSATVLTQDDGHVPAGELAQVIRQCKDVGIPETYAPRVAVVSRRYRPPLRVYAQDAESPVGEGNIAGRDREAAGPLVTVQGADPRSLNLAHRARVKKAAGWMAEHIGHDTRYPHIASFQAKANEAVGVAPGGRDHATAGQMIEMADWMMARITEHCRRHSEPVPSWAEGDDATA